MSDQPCPGNCNSRYHKACEAYREAMMTYDPLDPDQSRPEPPDIRPRGWGRPVWCSEHAAQIRRELAQLDDLAALLAATADGYDAKPRTERVAGTSVPASPSEAADVLDEMNSMLTGWEQAYRDLRGWPSPPPRGDDASAQTTCIAWLTVHLDGILATAYAEQFGRQVLDWRRILARSTKAGVRKLRLPLRCPRCHLLVLVWTEGEDTVNCENPDCARVMTRSEYEAEVEVEAAAAAISRGEILDAADA
jgi:hypothetical protein